MDNLYNRVARRRRRDQKGFTLIELLVVIAVLGILAFIVIFNVVGVANRGNANACATDVKSVQSAVDAWINDNPTDTLTTGNLPGTDTGDWAQVGTVSKTSIVPDYIHTVPNVTECTTLKMALNFANGSDATNGYTVVGT